MQFIRSNKFYSLISLNQQEQVKQLFIQCGLNNTGLFNDIEEQIQLKFLIDNLELKVILEDDTIVKQGDMAGPQENVYFILEGTANVILEKRDFCYFDFENVQFFLNEHEEFIEKVDKKTQETFVKDILKRRFGHKIKTMQDQNKDCDIFEQIFDEINTVLGENQKELQSK